MNDDRMTPKALAEIERKAKRCADNKLPAFALVYSTERELALDAVPQMAAEIRRAWADNDLLKRIILGDAYRNGTIDSLTPDYYEITLGGKMVVIYRKAENGGTHEVN